MAFVRLGIPVLNVTHLLCKPSSFAEPQRSHNEEQNGICISIIGILVESGT